METRANETLFSSSYRDIWAELILPKLDRKDIWHIAATCQSARKCALKYLRQTYNKEMLVWDEKYYNKEIDWKVINKRNYADLITTMSRDGFFTFVIHAARIILFLAAIGLIALGDIHKDTDAIKDGIICASITLGLSLLIVVHNHKEWRKYNKQIDKELDFPRKQREKAINRRLTLFPEPQRPSIASTVKQNCIIL